MAEPWEMRDDEPAEAFHAFAHYRDLLPSRRSRDAAYGDHLEACEHRGGTEKAPQAPGNWCGWLKAHDWVARARAWDRECDRVRRLETVEAILDMRERHRRLGRAMQSVSLKALARYLQDERDVGHISPFAITQLGDRGAAIERAAYAEAAALLETTEPTEPDVNPDAAAEFVAGLAGDPELAPLLVQLQGRGIALGGDAVDAGGDAEPGAI